MYDFRPLELRVDGFQDLRVEFDIQVQLLP
jgi:hypothetical protein